MPIRPARTCRSRLAALIIAAAPLTQAVALEDTPACAQAAAPAASQSGVPDPCAAAPAPAVSAADDKKEALRAFIVAYRLADVWPQMAPKIARDSLARLEDAARADIDADALAAADAAKAQARVAQLLPQGRRDLESALRGFDADELAAYTAFEIYAKYFETAEIRDITAFFGSPTGQKLTTLAPTILVESHQGSPDAVLPRHFSEPELQEIMAFWRSPVAAKMNATAEQVREDMHAHFIERSEPALQAVARRLATQAEQPADASPAPVQSGS